MELRDDLEIAGRIMESYRQDLVEDAIAHGKSKHSVRSRACQAIEDQQLQILEKAFEEGGLAVGDVIFDAAMVQREHRKISQEVASQLLSRT